MGSRLKRKLNRARDKLRTRTTTTTSRPLVSARRKRTLDVSRLDEGGIQEEEMGSAVKNPCLQALLTDEILDHILRFVSVLELKRCRLVNKHWNSVATARWKKRGVVVKLCKYSGRSLMNFVNFSRRSGSAVKRRLTASSLLDKISGLSADSFLITDGSLVEYPRTIASFAAQCQSHLKILKLTMNLNISYYYQTSLNSIKQLLTTFLANLEHVVLDFVDTSAAILLDPNTLQQLELPNNANSSAKLKRLEILRCGCDREQQCLDEGLLAQLLRESHNLENLVIEQSKRAWKPVSPWCCYKLLFSLLNSGNCGGQLAKVKELSLTFISCHLDNCRLCNARVIDVEGEAALLQHSRLESLAFSGIPWKEMFSTFRHHQHTLRRLTIGAHGLPTFDHDVAGGEPDIGVILPNLWEFNARAQISYKSFTTLLTLYPQLGSLGLTNPTAHQLRYVWKHFVQLHTLCLHFVDSNSHDIFSTTSTAQDPQANNMMHLDSVLSGFSINSCEFMYAKIAADQTDKTILSKTLSEPPPLLACSNTILNLGKLRSLEIIHTTRELYPVRLTEVGIVLVLLKLRSLTKLTIKSCTLLLPGTMSLIERHVSPAMTLSISEQPEFSRNDLGQVKAMWL